MTSGANNGGMIAVILIDIIGLNAFVKGYGIQLFFMGLGRIIGPPIIGKNLRIQESHNSPLMMAYFQCFVRCFS